MLFSDPDTFRIHDWLISHSQLLIREAKSDSEPYSENIDLIFVGINSRGASAVRASRRRFKAR